MGALSRKSGICLGFLWPKTSGESRKPLGKLFKLMWIETLLPRRKNSLRGAVKKLCPSLWEIAGVDVCAQIDTKVFFRISRDCVAAWVWGLWQRWKFFVLRFAVEVPSPESFPVHDRWLFPTASALSLVCKAGLDLELWSPVFSERRTGGVGRWAIDCTETRTETTFQLLCSRALPTNPKPPHLLPFPPTFPPLMQGGNCREKSKLWLEICAWFWLLCSEGEGSLAKRNWRMALAQGTAQA